MSTECEVKIKRLLHEVERRVWDLEWQSANMEVWMHKALAEPEDGALLVLDAGT